MPFQYSRKEVRKTYRLKRQQMNPDSEEFMHQTN